MPIKSFRSKDIMTEMNIENFGWLVDNRSKIQRFLLELYEFKKSKQALYSKDTETDLWCDLVGIAFSLWRAVFLSDHKNRDRKEIINNAEIFLEEVIANNAINYPQDKKTQKWTGGYYINNARLRIVAAKNRLELRGIKVINDQNRDIFKKFDQLDEGGIEIPPLNKSWDIIYATSHELFETLQNLMQ